MQKPTPLKTLQWVCKALAEPVQRSRCVAAGDLLQRFPAPVLCGTPPRRADSINAHPELHQFLQEPPDRSLRDSRAMILFRRPTFPEHSLSDPFAEKIGADAEKSRRLRRRPDLSLLLTQLLSDGGMARQDPTRCW